MYSTEINIESALNDNANGCVTTCLIETDNTPNPNRPILSALSCNHRLCERVTGG